jgi:hypothetical protein
VNSLVDDAIDQFPVVDLAAGTVVGPGYTVGEMLGEGLLGPVYAITHEDGTEGALKLLRGGVIDERLTLERLAASLEQATPRAGVVSPRACGEHNGHLYLEMERAPGRTLREAIDDSDGGLPLAWIEHVFTALADLLVAVRPETHGHLGPEHVLIVQEPDADHLAEVRLLGWGRSWMLRRDLIGEEGLREESAWRKAPEEQSVGGRRAAPAQVWAVGVLLYEALVGTPPIGSYQLPSELRDDVPPAVDDVVEVALSFSASERFQGSQALAVALEEAFASLASDSGPGGKTLLMVAGVGLLALALVAGGLAMRPDEADLRADEDERRSALRAELNPGRVRAPVPPPAPGMVFVPDGEYLSGRFAHYDDEAGSGEREEARVAVKAFWIDELPFVNPNLDDPYAPPLTGMTYDQAKQLCGKFNKRLCSETEWEKACKGPKNQIFSYGDVWDAEACPKPGFFEGGYRLSDFPACVSGYGAVGMTGGVGEWTSTSLRGGHLVKPAEVGSMPKHARCAGRTDRPDDFKSQHIGMRCCHDPQ